MRALPVNGGGRVVEICLGASPSTQDGRRGHPSLGKYRGRRAAAPNLTDGPGQRIL